MRVRLALTILTSAALIVAAASARAQETSRVSVASPGFEGNDLSMTSAISADGRFVAFVSQATNLVPGDTNGVPDVFVHDRQTGVTSLVSVSSAGVQGSRYSDGPAISADGRFVAFHSRDKFGVPGDTAAHDDVFVHDRQTGETSIVSVDAAGSGGDGHSTRASISADGRFVAFSSLAESLVANDGNGRQDIFVHDRETGVTSLVSVNLAGFAGDGHSSDPAISADGRTVAFASYATDLVAGGPTGFTRHVFVHDRETGETSGVSVDVVGGFGDEESGWPAISADGGYVVFLSRADDLVAGDANEQDDVFVRDRQTGETSRVNLTSAGEEADLGTYNFGSGSPSISADGRFVAFQSRATNLVPGDSNARPDAFVHDRLTGLTQRVSVSSSGVEGDDFTIDGPRISADGGSVAFASGSANLVPGDTNAVWDVFVRELRDPAACRTGTVNSGAGPVTSVLTVNAGTEVVTVSVGAPIRIDLAAAPLGPDPGRYFTWVWAGHPSNPVDLAVSGSTLGCTVNPTPFHRFAAPQALLCLRGAGVPSVVCRMIEELPAPASAPWTVMKNAGYGRPIVFTFQAVLEDAGAGNPLGFSVTNAVTLEVE